MKKNKLYKIDLIFIIVIGLLGGVLVYSCVSVFSSYALLIIFLIYFVITYKENNIQYVKWYMYFVLPFFHIIFAMIGMGLTNFIIKLLGI